MDQVLSPKGSTLSSFAFFKFLAFSPFHRRRDYAVRILSYFRKQPPSWRPRVGPDAHHSCSNKGGAGIACRKFKSNSRNNQICLVLIIIMCWQFYKNVSEKYSFPAGQTTTITQSLISHHPKRERMRYFETCSLIDSSWNVTQCLHLTGRLTLIRRG